MRNAEGGVQKAEDGRGAKQARPGTKMPAVARNQCRVSINNGEAAQVVHRTRYRGQGRRARDKRSQVAKSQRRVLSCYIFSDHVNKYSNYDFHSHHFYLHGSYLVQGNEDGDFWLHNLGLAVRKFPQFP